ncbi:MAG TPA: PD-(D/E)XK nuclease family protein [Enhygromyxa sp.]|nr:PD-(D/E)XK nuclease family protein [Enhygromyxa sp.]
MAAPQRPERTLRILASRERTAELLRERTREQGVALALGLIDLRSFEDRLLRACELAPIGTTEARLAVSAVAPEAARGTTLAELATQPGFAESFLELWDTLRRAGVDAVGFERLADRLGRTQGLSARRFAALARIASAYERRLSARGVVDAVGARVRLPAAIGSLGRGRLAALTDGARRLWVERSPELPLIRARMWEALARAGLEVAVEIPVLPGSNALIMEVMEVAPELASALELLRRNLVEEAPSVELIMTPLLGGEGTGEFASAGLIPFVPPAKGRALVNPTLRSKLALIDAEDQRAELRGVCAAIRELLHRGVAPHRITIAVPRLGLARHRVLAALDAAELPHEETRGQPVIQAAPLRLTLALIDAAERELPREALADVLESAYVARRDSASLLSALREAGSRDDRGIGHLGRLRAHAAKLARTPHPDHERRAKLAQRYQALATRWEPLFDKLRLPRQATLRAHLDAVFAALRALGVPRRCLELPALGEGARERRLERDAVAALARDRAALEALEIAGHGLDEAAAAVGVADQQVPLTDFRAHLEAALSGIRERPPGVRGAGIGVCDLAELARSRSDFVFVIHAVEGELPGPGRPLPFLDEDDRALLDRAAGRSVLAGSSGTDAGSFALACAGVREQLTISSHRQDEGGREVMRSRWFVALERALGPDHAARELAAGVVASLSQCSTRGQLLTRLGSLAREPSKAALAHAHALLKPALDWSSARASDLGRSSVALDARARELAHARLGFVWAGPTTWRGSATSLEDYAACPFRFFAARVLRIRPRPSIRDELDAAEQGSVRHEVIAEVMQALRREGLTPLEGGDRTAAENRLAREVCEAVLDRWQQLERTGPAPLWLLHRDLIARDLLRVLEGERRAAIEAWEPGEFEIGFGVVAADGSDAIEGVPLAIPDRRGERRFELIGRVDRIDYRGDGREREGLIIDYKSGRVGDRLRYDQLARTQLQLPLYAAWLAARRPELTYTDAAYVSLRDGERSQASLLDLSLSSVELDGLLELEPTTRRELRSRSGSGRGFGDAPKHPPQILLRKSGGPPGPSCDPAGRHSGSLPAAAIGALDLPETGQRNLADNVWALLGGIAEARFDVRPHDPGRACRYCPYGPVCRVERGDELEPEEGGP